MAAVCLFMSQLTEICPMSVSSERALGVHFAAHILKQKELLETVFPESLHIQNYLLSLEVSDSLKYMFSFWENFHVLQYLSNVITEKSGLI